MIFEINNIDRNIVILKTLKMFLLTYYINFKIINRKITFNIKSNIYIIIIGIISGIVRYDVNYMISNIILIIAVSILFSENNIGNSILTTIISLSINYIVGVISIVICFGISKITTIKGDYIKLIIMTVFHIILLYRILKIKKFRYGISFLKKSINDEYMDLLILNISITILFSAIVMFNTSNEVASIIGLEIIISAIIMFITIRKAIQLYYKQKLLIQELTETKKELIDKTREIKELEDENLSFSKKSHSLAHKQRALEYKIQQLLNKTEMSTEETIEVKEKIEKLKKEVYRQDEIIELDKTEVIEVDDMLKYMQSECNKNNIEFIFKLKGNIHYMTNNIISKDNLEILLADHIKNAIIAINHTDNINRSICVKLYEINKMCSLSILDSGVEFDTNILKNLGKKPSTAYKNEGGTGMGFMNTFDILRKYKASLKIEEYNKPSKDNYTKAIIIKFDKKNKFKIESYRQNEIENMISVDTKN